MTTSKTIHDEVRARYAEAARAVTHPAAPPSEALDSNRRVDATLCCGPTTLAFASGNTDLGGSTCCSSTGSEIVFGSWLYDPLDRDALPDAAMLASLGCGNPTSVAELRPGEIVLDLGSGGGLDVLLSSRRVGPTGHAIGLDMTPEMLELARRNAADAGATNVDFIEGTIEAIPLPDRSVDVIISNCVINLAADKPAVLAEMARVLRPGGRIGVSDIVARDDLTPDQRAERGSYAGCIAGALSFDEYERGLRRVGLIDIRVRPTHEVADGMFAATVQATKPAAIQAALAGASAHHVERPTRRREVIA